MDAPFKFYEDKISAYTLQLRAVREKIALISGLRLAAFIGTLLFIYFLVRYRSSALLFLSILFLILFICLVFLSQQFKSKRSLLEKLLFLNQNELGILKNEPNAFDNGQALLVEESYLNDLDIFGNGSVFHLLNRATSSHGRDKLASLLKQSLQSPEEIKKYQDAVRMLVGQVDERQSLTAHGLLNKEEEGNLHSLSDWLKSPAKLLQKAWVLIGWWLIVLYNCISLMIYAGTGDYRPLLIGVLAGWVLTGLFGKYITEQHRLLGKKQAVLQQYSAILRIFNAMDAGNSMYLQDLQRQCGKAYVSIGKLARLCSFFDQQMNLVVILVVNNLFLYNLWCVIALEKWKDANKADFPNWIESVGKIECLHSLAAFAFNNPSYSYPLPVVSEHPFIEARKIAHPLIPSKEQVPNDFSIGKNEKLVLVTGSNMSGKTTFLRTAGVNLLLAQCGAPVCAESFSFTPMQLLSSLRVSDSLQEHTSYFMAELKKLKQIIQYLQAGGMALVLVDEILRGTNSEDKTQGSAQFIQKLLQYQCLSLFATHDLTLSRMETDYPGQISNYCFESVIEAGELLFNYQLNPGVARNRNASFLMEKMGIV